MLQKYLLFLFGSDQDPAKPITEVISSLTQIALDAGSAPEFSVYTETQQHSPVNSKNYPLFKFGFNHL